MGSEEITWGHRRSHGVIRGHTGSYEVSLGHRSYEVIRSHTSAALGHGATAVTKPCFIVALPPSFPLSLVFISFRARVV